MGTRIANSRARGKSSNRLAKKPPSESKVAPEIVQILANLANCDQTPDVEKTELQQVIKKTIADHDEDADGLSLTAVISGNLSSIAKTNGYFFQGKSSRFNLAALVWNAKQSEHFKGLLSRTIFDANGTHGTQTQAQDDAEDLFACLTQPSEWIDAVASHASLPIHRHGYPFWIADPASGEPRAEARLDHYPARAGLAPSEHPGEKYIVLRLKIGGAAMVPRFADSCGYCYWRPGGRTAPIAECPPDLSGFSEAIVDAVTLGNIAAESFEIRRCI